MAFVRRPAFYLMEFDGDLAGLHIRMRGITGHGLDELGKTGATTDDPWPALPLFMRLVDRWDLEYADGGSVPVTFDAFMSHDPEFMRAVLSAWMEQVLPARYHSSQPTGGAAVQTVAVPDPVPELELDEREYHVPDEDDIAMSNLRAFSRAAA